MRAERNRLFIPPATKGTQLSETRFARLAGESWMQLPAPIRRRFSRHLADGERIVYVGEVAATHMTIAGRLLAQLARLVGAPLPLESGGRVPVTVIVTGSEGLCGQVWTRIYARARGCLRG